MSTLGPREMEIGPGMPTAVYRLFASGSRLLYVGVTGNIKARFAEHAATQPWWPDVARKTATWYPSRDEALQAESVAIRDERPLHNIAQGSVRADEIRITWDGVLDALVGVLSAAEYDVRQWHARMVTTGASSLGQIFRHGTGWFDLSPELSERLDDFAKVKAAKTT